MNRTIATAAVFGVHGIAISSAGIAISDWQYWVALLCMVLSFFIGAYAGLTDRK